MKSGELRRTMEKIGNEPKTPVELFRWLQKRHDSLTHVRGRALQEKNQLLLNEAGAQIHLLDQILDKLRAII